MGFSGREGPHLVEIVVVVGVDFDLVEGEIDVVHFRPDHLVFRDRDDVHRGIHCFTISQRRQAFIYRSKISSPFSST